MSTTRVTPTGQVIIATTDNGQWIILGPFDTDHTAWDWAHAHVPNLPHMIRSYTVAALSPPVTGGNYTTGPSGAIVRTD